MGPGRGARVAVAGIPLALLVFGLVVCLHYGRMGFMPLDQSIVWDAGWRILGGQVPFRDFVTTTSLVPGVLQAAFFAAGGVSWLVYCVHAALLNGLFAVGAYVLLRGEGLHPALAAVFGAASAIFFYPPFGVPYGDQHSFFFALLALVAAATARRKAGRSSVLLWMLVPACLLLGYLSKPVPAAFLLPAVAVYVLWPGANRPWSRAAALLGGAVASMGLVAGMLAVAGADLGLAWDYLVDLPLDSGDRRALYPGWLEDRAAALVRIGGRSDLLFPWAAGGSVLVVALLLVLGTRKGDGDRPGAAARPLLVGVLLWVGTVLFVGVTRNQGRNGHALLPVVLGLLAASAGHLARAHGAEPSRLASLRRRVAAGTALAVALVAVHDAVRFDTTVNATRLVHDGGYDPRRAEAARGQLPPALGFLEWGLASTRYSPRELTDVVGVVAAEERPVLLVSDSLVIYGLAGKPSLNPNLWYHPGVSMPRPDDAPRVQRLEALFLARLVAASPGLVVFDPPPGPARFRLDMLPRVDAWLRERRCDSGAIGPFPVWRLCPDAPGTPP